MCFGEFWRGILRIGKRNSCFAELQFSNSFIPGQSKIITDKKLESEAMCFKFAA